MDFSGLGKQPVSEARPQGVDVGYEETFELLQAEIDKLVSPTGRDTFSWDTVLTLSADILGNQSKDLRVAGYLSAALTYLQGVRGLVTASTIYRELLEHFWDDLYPSKKRMRGRISAIEWWVEKTGAALSADLDQNAGPDEMAILAENLDRIDTFVQEHAGSDISLVTVLTGVNALRPVPIPESSEPGEHHDSVLDQVEVEQVSSSVSPMAKVAPIEASGADDAVKQLMPLLGNIRIAAKAVREEKRHHPQAYRWLRFALWEPVKALPLESGGQTKIPPPDETTLRHLKTLFDEEDWDALLNSSERALNNQKNMFLLDLNFYSATAMKHLGKLYQQAHDSVCHETKHFIGRLPGIEILTFSDGTPFASSGTRIWLGGLMASGNDQASSLATDSSSESTTRAEIGHAQKMLMDTGNADDAVQYLQERLGQCESGKDKTVLKKGIASLLMSAGHQVAALAVLDDIFHVLIDHEIEVWDPVFALVAYRDIYTAFSRQNDDRYREKADIAYRKIARIKVSEAMVLSK